MTTDMSKVLLLCAATFSVSWTVTQEEIFKDFRAYLKDWACKRRHSWLCQKLAYLPTCVWCFSHWVCLLAVAVTGTKLVTDGVLGYVFAVFVSVVITNVYATVYQTLRALLRFVQSRADLTATNAKLAEQDLACRT